MATKKTSPKSTPEERRQFEATHQALPGMKIPKVRGAKPIGERAMTAAERQRKRRAKLKEVSVLNWRDWSEQECLHVLSDPRNKNIFAESALLRLIEIHKLKSSMILTFSSQPHFEAMYEDDYEEIKNSLSEEREKRSAEERLELEKLAQKAYRKGRKTGYKRDSNEKES